MTLSYAGKKKDYLITISTEFGDMVLILYDQTPKHKENFVKLAKEGYYDSTTFHRIIDDFMIQGGDPNSKDDNPNNDGQGGPNYKIDAEFTSDLSHVRGAVAAARTNNPQKQSSGSQFYIVEKHEGTHFLDGQYTVFGQVIQGLDVIDKIAEQPKNRSDRPIKDIIMTVTVKEVSYKKTAKLLKAATQS